MFSSIILPRRSAGWRDYYRKVGTRRAQAISKVCIAGSIRREGALIRDVRVAFGSVAPWDVLQGALRDPLLVTSLRLRLALALGIAFLMTVKPPALASVVVLALAAALGWLAGLAGERKKAWATP